MLLDIFINEKIARQADEAAQAARPESEKLREAFANLWVFLFFALIIALVWLFGSSRGKSFDKAIVELSHAREPGVSDQENWVAINETVKLARLECARRISRFKIGSEIDSSQLKVVDVFRPFNIDSYQRPEGRPRLPFLYEGLSTVPGPSGINYSIKYAMEVDTNGIWCCTEFKRNGPLLPPGISCNNELLGKNRGDSFRINGPDLEKIDNERRK
jgi:hypothetical protein